jgi:tRNA A37 threonylcarbamoyltransferase TsaD
MAAEHNHIKDIYILAIESSCDDTSCAIIKNELLLSNVTANQSIHQQYGGVIPELASRDHQKNIVPVVDAALKKAGITLISTKRYCCNSRTRIKRKFISWFIILQNHYHLL